VTRHFARFGLAAAIALALFGCGPVRSDLLIKNSSEYAVVNLEVGAEGKAWRLGNLNPDESVTFDALLLGEGGPTISWTWQGKRYSDGACYYSAPHIGSEGVVEIEGEVLKIVECR